jgi:hypothetical protein
MLLTYLAAIQKITLVQDSNARHRAYTFVSSECKYAEGLVLRCGNDKPIPYAKKVRARAYTMHVCTNPYPYTLRIQYRYSTVRIPYVHVHVWYCTYLQLASNMKVLHSTATVVLVGLGSKFCGMLSHCPQG